MKYEPKGLAAVRKFGRTSITQWRMWMKIIVVFSPDSFKVVVKSSIVFGLNTEQMLSMLALYFFFKYLHASFLTEGFSSFLKSHLLPSLAVMADQQTFAIALNSLLLKLSTPLLINFHSWIFLTPSVKSPFVHP